MIDTRIPPYVMRQRDLSPDEYIALVRARDERRAQRRIRERAARLARRHNQGA